MLTPGPSENLSCPGGVSDASLSMVGFHLIFLVFPSKQPAVIVFLHLIFTVLATEPMQTPLPIPRLAPVLC